MKFKTISYVQFLLGITVVVLGVLLGSLFNNNYAQTTPPIAANKKRADKKLKILSWNIYMLPHVAKLTGKRKRAKHIGTQLAAGEYDIIVFQEAFHRGARNIIKRKLKKQYPYSVGPANEKWISLKTNSGIWIWSKIPLKKLGTVRFTDCTGIDCWARKGALLVEAELEGTRFQILGTHLQATGEAAPKFGQIKQIEQLVTSYKEENVPQILCGDFNIDRNNEKQYPFITETLKVENGPLTGEQQVTSDGEKNDLKNDANSSYIDFIFYRSNGKATKKMKRWVSVLKYPWHKNHKDLSDHYGVASEIVFE